MKCSKCKMELIGNKKIVSKEGRLGEYVGDGLLITFGGLLAPIGMLSLGSKLYNKAKKYVKDEIEITCPHCKAKLTLTAYEYEELKNEIQKIRDEERRAKQNRVEY